MNHNALNDFSFLSHSPRDVFFQLKLGIMSRRWVKEVSFQFSLTWPATRIRNWKRGARSGNTKVLSQSNKCLWLSEMKVCENERKAVARESSFSLSPKLAFPSLSFQPRSWVIEDAHFSTKINILQFFAGFQRVCSCRSSPLSGVESQNNWIIVIGAIKHNELPEWRHCRVINASFSLIDVASLHPSEVLFKNLFLTRSYKLVALFPLIQFLPPLNFMFYLENLFLLWKKDAQQELATRNLIAFVVGHWIMQASNFTMLFELSIRTEWGLVILMNSSERITSNGIVDYGQINF
jgi:hypothetical protein